MNDHLPNLTPQDWLIYMLLDHPACLSELQRVTGFAETTLREHLATLEKHGLLTKENLGGTAGYRRFARPSGDVLTVDNAEAAGRLDDASRCPDCRQIIPSGSVACPDCSVADAKPTPEPSPTAEAGHPETTPLPPPAAEAEPARPTPFPPPAAEADHPETTPLPPPAANVANANTTPFPQPAAEADHIDPTPLPPPASDPATREALALLVGISLAVLFALLALKAGDQPSTSPAGADPGGQVTDVTTPGTPTTGNPGNTATPSRHEIRLKARSYSAKPFETVPIEGRYVGSKEGIILRLQRKEGGGWMSFPLPLMTNQSGDFTAHVELGKPGVYRLRLFDPEEKTASKVLRVRIK